MRYDSHDGWPYSKIEHWPPMTYRDRSVPTPEALAAFADFLKTDNSASQNRELQPWLPFCEGRCAFCYFPVSCEKQNVAAYIAALKKALGFYAKNRYVQSSVFNELYVGGGSPTVLASHYLMDILQFCRGNFNLTRDCTTKVTACTNSLSDDKIRLLSASKVNQLDIGIQTFDDSLRKMLLLRDSGGDARQKLKVAKKHGLSVSIDLLYNLPKQTKKQWVEDLKQALELEVESVDCYPLDLYADTPLARRIAAGELPPIGDDAAEMEMYVEAYHLFKENGYLPTCHNRFSRIKEDFDKPSSEVVGTGAGFFMGHIGSYLYSDIDDVKDYVAAVDRGVLPIARLATLSQEAEMRKAMMLIYLRVPVEREEFKMQFGKFPEEAFPDALRRLQEKQLIEIADGKICLTEKGDPWRFNIAWEFFKDCEN
ncbi:MAG: radical SAM protein [Candidatus Bathyarchaeota archaeon]|nr:radical SAM protein [Candidatus Bathyarchaeota archaeon]